MHDNDFAFDVFAFDVFTFANFVNSKFSVKMTQLYYINNSCNKAAILGRRRPRITLKMVSLKAQLNFRLFRLLIQNFLSMKNSFPPISLWRNLNPPSPFSLIIFLSFNFEKYFFYSFLNLFFNYVTKYSFFKHLKNYTNIMDFNFIT